MKTLLDEYMTDFVILTAICTDDGEGGQKTAYSESESFQATLRHDKTKQKQSAEQESTDSSYTIITKKSVILNFPMLVKSVFDGACFRITSDFSNVPPDSSSLDMRKVSAEKIILPEE